MDEILCDQEIKPLSIPHPNTAHAPVWERVRTSSRAQWERLCAWAGRMQDKAVCLGRPLLDPIPFLAIASIVGIAATVGIVYSPSYVVNVNGEAVGLVRRPAVYENVIDRVERRASAILGYSYTLDAQVSYDFALTKREELTSVATFENALMDTVEDIFHGYSLSVGGVRMGAAAERESLDALLEEIKAPYINENTTSAEFVENLQISHTYLPVTVEQDLDAIRSALTANTNGETSYEVKKGDTFMAIAYANNMTMKELEALNPDVNINRLHIGQLLTVKEEIPFLSVRTTENISYEEAIACPVKEVADSSMYQGESRVIDAGVPGAALVNADVHYLNGKEQDRTVLSSETLREPTTKVVAVGTKERPSWYPSGSFIWPASGKITSYFGYRYIFGSTSYHGGIDIKVSYGQAIKAADGGTVTFSGYKGSYGYLVIVDHGNGKQSYYGHNSSLCVSVGDKVYQGQTIAKAGSTGRSTGVHCHFEVKINGTSVNPLSYLP